MEFERRAGGDLRLSASMPDGDLVNALSQYLESEPEKRQALLEREGLLAPCLSLINLIEMRTIEGTQRWRGSWAR